MQSTWPHHAGYLVLLLSRLGAEFPELPLDPGRSGNAFPGCRRGALLLGDDCHENFVWWLEMVQRLGVHFLILWCSDYIPYDIIDWYYRQIYIPNHIYIYTYRIYYHISCLGKQMQMRNHISTRLGWSMNSQNYDKNSDVEHGKEVG